MSTEVIVVGAGGFGREVLDVIEAHNVARPGDHITVVGVADDAPSETNLQRLAARGYAYVGTIDDVLADTFAGDYVLGVAGPQAKRRIAARFEERGWAAQTLVHPTVGFGSMVSLGAGAIICAGAQLTTNIDIGRHAHINLNVTVGHDSVLGDFVTANPGAAVSGEVRVGDAVLIGTGAAILQGLSVGEDAQVGAGACVTKDVAAQLTVVGVPARPLGSPGLGR